MTKPASERNEKFAAALRRLADLLRSEDPDGNEFKGYAFREAARVVENLRVDMGEFDHPEDLPGIGKTLAGVWTEWVTTGKIGRLEDAEARLARGEFPDVNDLTRIRGVGIKKARQIHQIYGVETCAELAEKIEAGEVNDQRLVEAIESVREFGRRFRWQDAREIADRFVKAFARSLSARQLQCELVVAGSLRRRMPGAKDGDILGVFQHEDDRRVAIRTFTEMVSDPSGGERRATGIYEGMRIDFMTALEQQSPRYPSERGPALLHSTGPGDYNQALRRLARSKGLLLNERGLFGPDGLRRDDGTERSVQRELGVKELGPQRRGSEVNPPRKARRLHRGGRRNRKKGG